MASAISAALKNWELRVSEGHRNVESPSRGYILITNHSDLHPRDALEQGVQRYKAHLKGSTEGYEEAKGSEHIPTYYVPGLSDWRNGQYRSSRSPIPIAHPSTT